jgi:hypothetical protein
MAARMWCSDGGAFSGDYTCRACLGRDVSVTFN